MSVQEVARRPNTIQFDAYIAVCGHSVLPKKPLQISFKHDGKKPCIQARFVIRGGLNAVLDSSLARWSKKSLIICDLQPTSADEFTSISQVEIDSTDIGISYYKLALSYSQNDVEKEDFALNNTSRHFDLNTMALAILQNKSLDFYLKVREQSIVLREFQALKQAFEEYRDPMSKWLAKHQKIVIEDGTIPGEEPRLRISYETRRSFSNITDLMMTNVLIAKQTEDFDRLSISEYELFIHKMVIMTLPAWTNREYHAFLPIPRDDFTTLSLGDVLKIYFVDRNSGATSNGNELEDSYVRNQVEKDLGWDAQIIDAEESDSSKFVRVKLTRPMGHGDEDIHIPQSIPWQVPRSAASMLNLLEQTPGERVKVKLFGSKASEDIIHEAASFLDYYLENSVDALEDADWKDARYDFS